MKSTLRILAGLAVLSGTAPGAYAQADSLSTADRVVMHTRLAQAAVGFLASIDGLSEAQWRFKPAADRWSIAETAEHIVATDKLIGGFLIGGMPPLGARPDSAAAMDRRIVTLLADRTQRFDAPAVIQPAGKYATQSDLVAAFVETRNDLNDFLAQTRAPLRTVGVPHPAFGPMDGVQWVILVAGHEQRHTQQIEEVKRSPGYPAN